MSRLTRTQILDTLQAALEPLDDVLAVWEGGSVAFGRHDEWSDIDLQIDVADEHVAETVAVLEETLAALSPIELRYVLPQPAWHGHWQAFYQLREAGPFLQLDVLVIQHSRPNKFHEPEIHGPARVLFDKARVLESAPPLDRAGLLRQIEQRLNTLRVTFPLFQPLTLKEVRRGRALEAIAFYQAYTLRPLVEVLRIRYCPVRYNFHTRLAYSDLPPEVVATLEPLFFPRDLSDLAAKREQAEAWFNTTLAQTDLGEVARRLG